MVLHVIKIERRNIWPLKLISRRSLFFLFSSSSQASITLHSLNLAESVTKRWRVMAQEQCCKPCSKFLPQHDHFWMKAEFSFTIDWFYPLRGEELRKNVSIKRKDNVISHWYCLCFLTGDWISHIWLITLGTYNKCSFNYLPAEVHWFWFHKSHLVKINKRKSHRRSIYKDLN